MFAGKVVLVTGASSGIGAATAIQFAKSGAKLSLTGRNKENLLKTARECEAVSSDKPFMTLADITVQSYTEDMLRSTLEHFGKLDVLVNVAGMMELGSIENTSVEQFDRVFNINVKAVYHLTMLAAPHLVRSGGNIVNVCSLTGVRSFPGALSYGMSKAAVDQFTKCVALELAGKHVRVNCVSPGTIVTELHRRAGMDEETYQRHLEKSKLNHALGRPGLPEEVAHAILFLASNSSAFITGVNLPIDGGRHVMCPF